MESDELSLEDLFFELEYLGGPIFEMYKFLPLSDIVFNISLTCRTLLKSTLLYFKHSKRVFDRIEVVRVLMDERTILENFMGLLLFNETQKTEIESGEDDLKILSRKQFLLGYCSARDFLGLFKEYYETIEAGLKKNERGEVLDILGFTKNARELIDWLLFEKKTDFEMSGVAILFKKDSFFSAPFLTLMDPIRYGKYILPGDDKENEVLTDVFFNVFCRDDDLEFVKKLMLNEKVKEFYNTRVKTLLLSTDDPLTQGFVKDFGEKVKEYLTSLAAATSAEKKEGEMKERKKEVNVDQIL